MDKPCSFCKKLPTDKPFSRCSRCSAASYCSTECQTKDWKTHKSSNCKTATSARKTTPKPTWLRADDGVATDWRTYVKQIEPALCLAARSALGLGAPNSIRKTHVLCFRAERNSAAQEDLSMITRFVNHEAFVMSLEDLIHAEQEDGTRPEPKGAIYLNMRRELKQTSKLDGALSVGIVSSLIGPKEERYWNAEVDEVLELQPKEFLRLQTRFERVPRNPDWLATLAWAVLDRDRFLHPKLLRYADELLAAAALDLSGRSRNLVQRGMLLTLEENWTLKGRHGDGKIVMRLGQHGVAGTQDLDTVLINSLIAGQLVEGVEWPAKDRTEEEEEARWENRSDSDEGENLGPRWHVVREKHIKKKKKKTPVTPW